MLRAKVLTPSVFRLVVAVEKSQEMFNLTVDEAHTFYVGEQGWLVHNADISLQQKGGLSDFNLKGFHFQYGKGEFSLRPTLLPDGNIDLKIDVVGKKGMPVPSVREVERYLAANKDQVLSQIGEAIDKNKIAGLSRADQPWAVQQARLIGRALQGKNPFNVVCP